MKCPEEVQLSREDGEALRTRLAGDALTADDRRVLDQVLQWYFWLLFALQEATFSLKRLRALLFGEKPHTRKTTPPTPCGSWARFTPATLPVVEPATTHYRQALALAEELGMRPLVAHCHRDLGRCMPRPASARWPRPRC